MAFYSYIFTANYKRYNERIKKIAKNETRSSLLLKLDNFICVFRYGMGLTDYINFEIYKKGKAERVEYASIKAQNLFYETVSPSEFKKDYTVKPRFLEKFKDYCKRDFVVPNGDNFEQFEEFLNNNPVYMEKPYDGLGGAGVRKVKAKDNEDRQKYYNWLVENKVFIEQLVSQHDKMNELCPTSVNTLRVVTFNNNGKPRIIWCGLRIGNGVNCVDNFHAGGMCINVDINTGRLYGEAIDMARNTHESHPVTKVKFDGFELPYFKEMKEMVLKASLESDKILVVGWDVALTPEGPVIIEGNRRPGFDIIQALSKRGRKDIMREVLIDLGREDIIKKLK